MGVKLAKEIIDLLAEEGSSAVLATIDEHGFPHAVGGLTLRADEQGNLLYLEHFESSQTNRNLTRSIWFNGKVAIALSNRAGTSIQIKGKPVRVHITGPLFLKYYNQVRHEQGDVNLAAVWEIEPDEIIDERQAVRQALEQRERPFFTHLDRIAR